MTTASVQSPIAAAAAWLANQPTGNPRIVPELRQRFSLSAKEAWEAIALACNVQTPAGKDSQQ